MIIYDYMYATMWCLWSDVFQLGAEDRRLGFQWSVFSGFSPAVGVLGGTGRHLKVFAVICCNGSLPCGCYGSQGHHWLYQNLSQPGLPQMCLFALTDFSNQFNSRLDE